MGRTYGYDLIARRADAERLVRALAARLDRESRGRLLKALAGGVEGVTDRAARAGNASWETDPPVPRDVCLSVLFPADSLVTDFVREVDLETAPVDGRLPVGCVWTSLDVGDQYVRLRATAATSGMSVLFARSPGVRSTFVDVGREGGALLVLFDQELGDETEAVWPHAGHLAVPVEDDEETFSVDLYSAALLARAERASG